MAFAWLNPFGIELIGHTHENVVILKTHFSSSFSPCITRCVHNFMRREPVRANACRYVFSYSQFHCINSTELAFMNCCFLTFRSSKFVPLSLVTLCVIYHFGFGTIILTDVMKYYAILSARYRWLR